MIEAFVLDASMTMAWHFADEETTATAAVEQLTVEAQVFVPGNWHGEVANALMMGERRGRATLADSARFVDRLRQLDLIVDALSGDDVMDRVLPLARAHGLTICDAFYLELAERRGLPLASLDGDLNAASRHAGIDLIGEPA